MISANPSAVRAPNPWILGTAPDLLLIVLAPILIVPLFWAAQMRMAATEIAIYVAAFGAVGHHLPGMLRAYGDRDLFARFRTRFVVAPILLVAGCVVGVYFNLVILTLVALLWGFWHAVMQVYGFARIYDAKMGSTAVKTAKLDWLMLGSWFLLGLLSSGGHMAGVLSKLHLTGGPLISAQLLESTRSVVWVVTFLVSGAFVHNAVEQWREGRAASPAKLLLMMSSIGVYWYAMVYTHSTLIGIALFEVFHDIQYLAIVWGFSTQIVEKNSNTGAFARFLFRRSLPFIILYVVLVLAYGSLGLLIPQWVEGGVLHKSLGGVLIASALLHFYFDGFIWKVRESATRAGLDLEGGAATGHGVDSGFAPWAPHAFKWSLLLLPILLFGFSQLASPPEIEKRIAAAEAHPFAEPHHKVGRQLSKMGRTREALHHFEQALRLDPAFAAAHHEIGMVLMRTRPREAVPHFERVVLLEPDMKQPRLVYGDALRYAGRLPEAIEQYRRAAELGAEGAQGKLDEALAKLESVESGVRRGALE